MSRARTGIDITRLAALVQRPGIDPRRWVVLAEVIEVGIDSEEGMLLADVRVVPTGEEMTVVVASPYAGDGYGLWMPPSPGMIGVVLVPEGDPGASPVLIASLWSVREPAPVSDLETAEDSVPTEDVVLRVEEGKNLRVRVKGAGTVHVSSEGDGQLTLETKGAGDVRIQATGSGKVKIGDTALQPAVLGNTLYNWMQNIEARLTMAEANSSGLLTAFNTHAHVVTGTLPPGPVAASAVPPPIPTSTFNPPTPVATPDPRCTDTEVK